MMNQIYGTTMPPLWGSLALVLALVGFPICHTILRGALKASFKVSILSALVLYVVGCAMAYHVATGTLLHGVSRNVRYDTRLQQEIVYVLSLTAIACLPMLGVPFVVFLIRKWFGQLATEEERAIGSKGFAAWFRLPYLAWAGAVALGWSAWTDMQVISALALAVLLLGAMPAARLLMSAPTATPSPEHEPDLNPEREQILRMVEEKKINADEGVELLNALAAPSVHPPRAGIQITPPRRIVLAGAALVLVGFLLPWFAVNLSSEMRRAQAQLGLPPEAMKEMSSMMISRQIGGPIGGIMTNTNYINGSDVGHGLGWIVLLLVAGAAAAPYLVPTSERQTLRLATFLPLIAAGAILLYLTASNMRYVSYGLLMVLVGYGFALAGYAREWRAQSPAI